MGGAKRKGELDEESYVRFIDNDLTELSLVCVLAETTSEARKFPSEVYRATKTQIRQIPGHNDELIILVTITNVKAILKKI